MLFGMEKTKLQPVWVVRSGRLFEWKIKKHTRYNK